MTQNFLHNSLFTSHITADVPPPNMGEFCEGWYIEHSPGCLFNIGAADLKPNPHGVRVEVSTPSTWLRIWQPIEFSGLETSRLCQVQICGRKIDAGSADLDVEWMALLKMNNINKRVFAKKLIFDGAGLQRQWREIRSQTVLSDLASATPYIFAIHFSGGAGIVEISSALLSCSSARQDAKDERAIKSPSPLPRAPYADPVVFPPQEASRENVVLAAGQPAGAATVGQRAAAEIIRVSGGKLIGWAELPTSTGDVLVVIDGEVAGSVTPHGLPEALANGPNKLRTRGFALTVPEKFLDGTIHSVGLRDPTTGRRVGDGAQKIVFPDPKIAKPVLPAKAAAAAAPVAVPQPPAPASSRRRVAVISWDIAHNPVGRAFLLADMLARDCEVELIGPMFPVYGNQIWPPIGDSAIKMHAFPAPTLRDLLVEAKAIADRVKCDVVHVGKPRFPSLLIGMLIKRANGCPMVVDVDDHELSFFTNRTQVSLDELAVALEAEPDTLDKPYTEIWTRYAESLVGEADGVTVSNYALQERFGGVVVRHGRDESVFDPKLYVPKTIRTEFGYTDDDRVILFLGTPRPHKGVFEIADALETLNDDRLALCVIGTINDRRVSSRFSAYKRARIALHPDQPWKRLPELVAMADAVFILQDPTSAISDYQIPAKLTDALALGIPVYVTPVPPLADMIAAKVVHPVANMAALESELRNISARSGETRRRLKEREYYLTELSYAVNRARLGLAYDTALARGRRDTVVFDQLLSFLERTTQVELPRFTTRWRAPAIWRDVKPDVAFFWKQNDSDIYGRRPDMMAKYLLKSGAVRRVFHFDAPISAADLDKQTQHGENAIAHQGNLVYLNVVRRVLRQADSQKMIRRTFVFRPDRTPVRYLGADLPPREAYGDFIRAALRDGGISEAPLLWVCPIVFDYPLIKSIVQPSCVVADIIDDQRRWQARESYKQRIVRAYSDILADADFVIANCEPVRQGFTDLRADIAVVPNGAEIFDDFKAWPIPEELTALPRPIIGYVGNLRDRVDLGLIAKVADRYPTGSVVLIGSAHDRPEVLVLGQKPNIHLLGVKPYNDAVRYIRGFDVAMVPHLRNDLSENMNPLKLYVYFALGVAIVTTDLANIGDIGPFAGIAADHDEFLAEIERAVTGKPQPVSETQRAEVLERVSWDSRVRDVLARIGLV